MNKNSRKRISTFMKVFLMVLLLCIMSACGKDAEEEQKLTENTNTIEDNEGIEKSDENDIKDEVKDDTSDATEKVPEKVVLPDFIYYYEGKELSAANLESADKILDADYVYNTLTYTPQMFYGEYILPDEMLAQYMQEMDYREYDDNGYLTHITGIPYGIEAGLDNLNHNIAYIPNHNWARLKFNTEEGYLVQIYAAYTVSGKTITFTPLKSYAYDKEKQKISYSLSEEGWTYDFSFKGNTLTLSQNGKSVAMQVKKYGDDAISKTSCYLEEDSERLEDNKMIIFYDNKIFTIRDCYGEDVYCDDVVLGIAEDGLFMLSWADENGVSYIRQFVFFDCGAEGYILADGTNTYYYTGDSYSSDLLSSLTIEDISKLERLSESRLEEITEKRADLLEDLAAAYNAAGLNVKVNDKTGEIILDSTVLFDVNESAVSAEGKEFLKTFVSIYASVVFDEKYEGFVSKIMIEGHTDTTGAYDWNLQLSQYRADSVRDFCVSQESGLDSGYADALASSAVAVGYSCDNPVYDANGNVDMDASRRVAFRFLINLEY